MRAHAILLRAKKSRTSRLSAKAPIASRSAASDCCVRKICPKASGVRTNDGHAPESRFLNNGDARGMKVRLNGEFHHVSPSMQGEPFVIGFPADDFHVGRIGKSGSLDLLRSDLERPVLSPPYNLNQELPVATRIVAEGDDIQDVLSCVRPV
jgi:hypothetical protein